MKVCFHTIFVVIRNLRFIHQARAEVFGGASWSCLGLSGGLGGFLGRRRLASGADPGHKSSPQLQILFAWEVRWKLWGRFLTVHPGSGRAPPHPHRLHPNCLLPPPC